MAEPVLPPMLQVALEPTWYDAYRVLIRLMRDRGVVLPLKVAVAAGAAGVKPVAFDGGVDWPMRRSLAAGVHEILADAPEIDLSNAWWLLSLDPQDTGNCNRAHCALLHLSVLLGPRPDVDSRVRGWGMLAKAAAPPEDQDPFACARRLALRDWALTMVTAEQPDPTHGRGVDGLTYFAAGQPTQRAAKDLVFNAVADVLTTQKEEGLLAELETIRGLQSDVKSWRQTAKFAERFDVFAEGAHTFSVRHLSEIKRALGFVALDPRDPAGVRLAAAKIAAVAEEAVTLGVASPREAQAVACAWGMVSLFHSVIGAPRQKYLETDYFAAAHRNAVALQKNFATSDADDGPDEPDDEAPEDVPVPPGGRIVVLPCVGGVTNTHGGREAAAALISIAGIALERARTPDVETVRASLRAEFPHFVLQIETLLADLTEFVTLRPTLLLGDPGVGKSRFVVRFAAALGIALHRYDGAGASDNAFSGTPRRWATGEPSVPLEAIRWSGIANPLVMIDELDKAGRSSKNGSLASSMLPFLDKVTSSRYADSFALTTCDLSHVNFLATANDERAIPPPLKDRFRLLHLPHPRPEHLPALARSLVADIAEESGIDPRWFPNLDSDELDVVASLWRGGSMRRLRAIVERMLRFREQFARH